MTGIDVHTSVQYVTATVELGRFCSVQTHVGGDHVRYADIHCARGRLSLTVDELAALVFHSQEALER